jgi:atypical dual specificity phosphatase
MPPGFSWVDEPYLAALAHPEATEDLVWLRRQGVDVLISLSENPPPRSWINDAGLMAVHVPVPDMTAPSEEQLETCVDVISRARKAGMGVAVHCAAGRGRTGTVLAAYLVSTGQTAADAIARIRELRPGSVETPDQEEAIERYARRRGSQ